MDIFEDLDENTTCEDLEASTFYTDVTVCFVSHCMANDCTTALTALEKCAEEAYPDTANAEPECPDLCGWEDTNASTAIDEEKAVVIQETVSKDAAVRSSMTDYEIVLSKPHVSKAIKTIEYGAADEDFPCVDEWMALFTCVGTPCVDCMSDIFNDLDESTTCEDLEASTFCTDVTVCFVSHCMANDCTTALMALEKCAEEAYPDTANAEPECPDLCGWEDANASTAIDEEKAVVVQETVSKDAAVRSSMTDYEIVLSKPHVSKAIKTIEYGAADEDFPCVDEWMALFTCVGTPCVDCMSDIFNDLDESTTCEDLEASTFCTDVTVC